MNNLILPLIGAVTALMWIGLTALSYFNGGTEEAVFTFLCFPAGLLFGKALMS